MAREQWSIELTVITSALYSKIAQVEAKLRALNALGTITPQIDTGPVIAGTEKVKSAGQRMLGALTGAFDGFGNILMRRLAFSVATTIERVIISAIMLIPNALKAATEAGMEFEQAMKRAATVAAGGDLSILDDTFNQLAVSARALAKTTSFTATEVAGAFYEMASSGLSVIEIIAAMPSVVAFAAASMGTLTQSTDIMTQIMKSFSMEGKDLEMVADVLVVALNKTTLNVDRLAAALKYAAPAAGAIKSETMSAGDAFKEMIAVVAMFVDSTKQGGISGRAFRQMMATLEKPTRMAADAIATLAARNEEAGLTMDDFRPTVTGIIQILKNFAIAGASTAEVLTILGVRAGPVAIVAINKLKVELERNKIAAEILGEQYRTGAIDVETYIEQSKLLKTTLDTLLDAFEEGDKINIASKQMAEFLNTVKGLWTILKAYFEELGIQLFDIIRPALVNLISVGMAVAKMLDGHIGIVTQSLKFLLIVLTTIGTRMAWATWGAALTKFGGAALTANGILAGTRAALLGIGTALIWPVIIAGVIELVQEIVNGSGIIRTTIAAMMDFFIDVWVSLQDMLARGLLELANLFPSVIKDKLIVALNLWNKSVHEGADEAKGLIDEYVRGSTATDALTTAFDNAKKSVQAQGLQLGISEELLRRLGASTSGLTQDQAELFESLEEEVLGMQAATSAAELSTIAKIQLALTDQSLTEDGRSLLESLLELAIGFQAQIDATAAAEEAAKRYDSILKGLGFDTFTGVTGELKKFEVGMIAAAEVGGDLGRALQFDVLRQVEAYAASLRDKGVPLTDKQKESLTDLEDAFYGADDAAGKFTVQLRDPYSQNVFKATTTTTQMFDALTMLKDRSYEFFGLMTEEQIDASIGEFRVKLIGLQTTMSELSDDAMAKLIDEFFNLRDAIDDTAKPEQLADLDKLLDRFREAFPEAAEMSTEAFIEFLRNMREGSRETSSVLDDIWGKIVTGFANAIGEMIFKSTSFKDFIEDLFKGVVKLLVGTIFKDLIAGLSNLFATGALKFGGMIGDIAAGLVKTFGQTGAIGVAVAGLAILALALSGVFGGDTLKKRIKQAGEDLEWLGEISEDTAKKVAELALSLGKAGVQNANLVAQVILLGDILRAEGLYTIDQWNRATNLATQAAILFSQGIISEKDALNSLNSSIPELVANIHLMGEEGRQAFESLKIAVRESGLEVEELTKYLLAQATALADLLAPLLQFAEDKYARLTDKVKGLTVKIDENVAAQKDVRDRLIEINVELNELDPATEGYSGTVAGLTEEKKKLLEQLYILGAEYQKLIGRVDDLTGKMNTGAQAKRNFRFAADALALSIQDLVAQGVSWSEIIDIFGPQILVLADQAKRFNIELPPMIRDVAAVMELMRDHPRIQMMSDSLAIMTETFKNLMESGIAPTQNMFNTFKGTLRESIEAMHDLGATPEQLMIAFGPAIGELIRLHQDYGFKIDENTAAALLLAGVDIENLPPSQVQLQEEMNKNIENMVEKLGRTNVKLTNMNSHLRELVKLLGGVASAFGSVADAAGAAATASQGIGGGNGAPNTGGGGPPQQGGTYHTGGIIPDFPAGTRMARVMSGEIIAPKSTLGQAIAEAIQGSGSGGGNQPVNVNIQIGGRQIKDFIMDVVSKESIDGKATVSSEGVAFRI